MYVILGATGNTGWGCAELLDRARRSAWLGATARSCAIGKPGRGRFSSECFSIRDALSRRSRERRACTF